MLALERNTGVSSPDPGRKNERKREERERDRKGERERACKREICGWMGGGEKAYVR